MIMSFYRGTPVRCERPKGVKNPRGFLPNGRNPWETLRYAQCDIAYITSKLDTLYLLLSGKKYALIVKSGEGYSLNAYY
jgi:hypothetical protein